MAGLIQGKMQQGAPAPSAAPPVDPEMMEDDGPDIDPDTDPGYTAAMKFAMAALYENGAAKDVAKSLKAAPNIVEGLANTAYEIMSITDERTEGAVPDELLVLLTSKILEEVCDIAEAAGIEVMPADVATALKQMILRFVGEQGADTAQLQAAMDEVNAEGFNEMGNEGGGE